MSANELKKLETIQHVCDKRIRQIDAAQTLNLSRRQIELLSNVVYGESRSSLLMSLHFFHSIDKANIFHNIR